MNFTTGNLTGIKLDLGTAITRNSRTLNNPIVGLLLAAGILARVAQAKQTSTASSSAGLVNPWLQLQSIASGATPVQIAPSPVGAQPNYGYYPPYPLAAPPSAYPWWYAVEPFSLYPVNGYNPQIVHVHGGNEEHEEHKDGISYPEDHAEDHSHPEHHDHSHEVETEHLESGEHSGPGSYEAESENVDKQTASNENPISPNNEIKPVMESAEESKLEPVAIQMVEPPSFAIPAINESSANDELVPSTIPSVQVNSTLLNEATRTVQSIVNVLHKFGGNYSRIKTSDPTKQRQNHHQLVLQNQQNSIPKNSVTNILVQLNTTSANELLQEDDRIAEGSDIAPSQVEGTPLMLVMAGASNTMRRQHRPNEQGKQPLNGRKGTTTTKRPAGNKNQNRQRPQQKKTTTFRTPVAPAYEDDEYEYELTTQRYKPTRRTTVRRRPDYRRTTAPPRKYDDYDYDNYHTRTQTPAFNRRKQGGSVNIYNKNRNGYNNRMRPSTMSAYDDDFDDAYGDDPSQYYSNDDYAYRPAQAQAQIDYADYSNDKENEENGNDFVARQGTTEPDYVDESTTTTSADTTTTETAPTTGPSKATETQTENTGVTMNATMPVPTGYPYGPAHPHQPGYGYGPSNGNENISITYGPPTGGGETGGGGSASGSGAGGSPQQYIAAGGPSLDWYNQYTKQNVFKRIQDLLAPNNFYSPQYDNDKYNYNDNTF